MDSLLNKVNAISQVSTTLGRRLHAPSAAPVRNICVRPSALLTQRPNAGQVLAFQKLQGCASAG